jgi:hypothetical protein
MLLVAAGGCALVIALLGGVVLTLVHSLSGDRQSHDAPAASFVAAAQPVSEQDALAAAPMPTAGPSAALPAALSTRAPELLLMPAATRIGPADVPSGYPQTPEGALAQLAAIDRVAMEAGSLDGVRQVIAAWAAPGGPSSESWSGVRGMASLLSALALPADGGSQASIVVHPAMGLIKGTFGDSFAVVCVDFDFTVTGERTVRMAIADCQRMQWTGDRWLIGPGPEPAQPPSIWPGTAAAIDAGYREIRNA